METLDSCVTCAEGVDVQHQYEQKLLEEHLTSKQHGSLTEKEVAVIRRQLLAVEARGGGGNSIFPDVDDLNNLCGIDSSEEQHNADRCVVCLEQPKGNIVYAEMPCCQQQHPNICTACVLLLASPTSGGASRVGRCLGCRQWLSVMTTVDSAVTIDIIDTEGQCDVCNQTKSHLVEQDNGKMCDACFLGKRRALLYECKECHGHQRIPHPMYRYQPSVEEFGDVNWACQLECQRFTKWKILEEQAKYIPVGDAPLAWGDDYVEVAMQRVQEARRIVKKNDDSASSKESPCVIQ
mmetsp:Transcript_3563/g.5975  ORF Transcript_3563/g.5975 Transcript_3563/m.5975 type:complete len:293 (-) Transcript_3563:68-946(-)